MVNLTKKGFFTMSKTPHDILIAEAYTTADGEEKTSWTRAGVCFEMDNGGFSGEITNGLALSGKFIIKERTPKA